MADRRGSSRTAFAAGLALVALLAACAAEPKPMPQPWPEPAAVVEPDPVQQYADDRLAAMTLPEKVASLFMIRVPGTDAATIRATVDATGVGGIIDMADNVPGSAAALAAVNAQLSADSGLPILIAIDQ